MDMVQRARHTVDVESQQKLPQPQLTQKGKTYKPKRGTETKGQKTRRTRNRMMEYDNELIKDFITEKDPTIERDKIVIDKIYEVIDKIYEIPLDFTEDLIMVNYYFTVIKNVYGIKKQFTYKKDIIINLDEYKIRLRDQKIKELGI